ncbi:hypothetical protein N9104_02465 [Pseudomonadales bacterium]|nr:hypothetical protein [Pseudomonadales bacterium]
MVNQTFQYFPLLQDQPLLNERQAAIFLGAAASSVKQSRHTGMLFGKPSPSFVKCGRSTRYKLSALLEFRDQFPEYRSTSEYQKDETRSDGKYRSDFELPAPE